MGCLVLSQVDSFREPLPEVRVRDADLYSQKYMLHMLFLHLANGSAAFREVELWLHCLPAEVVCVFSSWKAGRFGAHVRRRAGGVWL